MKEQANRNTILRVETKRQRKQFINFPYQHYKSEKYWVPPLKMEQKKLIDEEDNPFYENADIALFLARQNGAIKGRIAAIEDRRFNDYHHTKTGFFGFFECVDSQNIANILLKTASGWLKDRGLTDVLGPASPGMMDEIGILVDGFDHYPSFLMPYNKPYYPHLLENEGFTKQMDLYTFRVVRDDADLERLRRGRKIVKHRNPGLEIRQIDLKKIDREVEIVRDLFNSAWSKNWGFIPLTKNELAALADDLKMILDPKFAHIIEIKGEPVAFSIGLPDLNQALRHMNGTLFPTGIFKLLWYQRKINSLRTALMGVRPEYRGKGIDALLHLQAIENGFEEGIETSEVGWVLETNKAMVHVAERLDASIEKTYRMYGKEL